MDKASTRFGGIFVLSQIRGTQNLRYCGYTPNVETFFSKYTTVSQNIWSLRSHNACIQFGSARLYVNAHHKKRFVIAIKYEGESEYRYLIASNLSWRTEDIIQAYTYRWDVPVFFGTFQLYEGWGHTPKQPGYEGSSRSLILSLLLDLKGTDTLNNKLSDENKRPAATVGGLQL